MRLLKLGSRDEFSLTKDFVDDAPKYAILSHTWGVDEEEATFDDLEIGSGTSKAGYAKLQFCGRQAKKDGLEYFWVDTCCINKANHAELSEAITSMFRWYRNAEHCYVYLSDVSIGKNPNNQPHQTWEAAFRNSRWFTRGWTLQELIAPKSVKFFSREEDFLGDKKMLGQQIQETTGIPLTALSGSPLTQFSITERLRWAEKRNTRRKEDKAYCLLGIFDIFVPLIYGEGDHAFVRLKEEIGKRSSASEPSGHVHWMATRPANPLFTGRAPSSVATPKYDLGIRLGHAPQIDEDNFIGRESELEQLQTWLTPQSGRQNIVALSGLGGMGKTQLSIHMIRRSGSQYSSVFWLNAKDENTLKAGLAALATEVADTPVSSTLTDVHEEERLVHQARQWLSQTGNNRWLIVYDNYDDPCLPGMDSLMGYDIRRYFPPRAHGSILITTRSPRLLFGKQLRLKKLEKIEQSLAILVARSGRQLDGDASATRLAQRLDGLPLALATAGAYLNQSVDSFEDYLEQYNDSWNDLSRYGTGPIDYEERTLYSTWNVSFEQVQHQDPQAAQLLKLMAYLDNQDLWYELFQAGVSDIPAWWGELLSNRARFNRAISRLHDYSLVEVSEGRCSLHACVHDWTLEYLNRETEPEKLKIAIHCVAASVSWETEADYWVKNRRVLPHARRFQLVRLQLLIGSSQVEPADLVYLAALYKQNDLNGKAEEMYVRALRGYEKAWGAEHTSTLDTVNNLGILYRGQGKIVEAEEMYIRALRGKEKAWGAEHTSTLATVNNLGILYADQGKIVEAEEMYIRALRGKEKAWGAEHTSTLDTVNNLGILYRGQGKIVEAEEMYIRALRGKEKAWGAEHTSTLNTVNNLGILYRGQGKIVEAEEMYIRALRGYEKAWGAEHTSTLDTVNNLGNLYRDQGKIVEAEEMYIRALRGYEKAWGAEHTSTLDTVNNLGNLYRDQGKIVEAEEMYIRALRGKEKAWGAEHTSTLDTVNNLGSLYADQGKIVEAEEMYIRALRGYEKAWGAEHTSTLDTVNNLGILYRDQGKIVEAEEMYIRALRGKEKAWGAEHTSTLDTVNNLGILYRDQGKIVEAEEMYIRALRGYEKAWGAEHTSTLDTVNNLGNLYRDQGKIVEAEEMYIRALRGKEKAWGAEHMLTLDTVNNLGSLYADQGKIVEAEEMYIRALRG